MASRRTAWSADEGERVLRGLHEHDRLVLPALQALQEEFGYVHPDAVAMVASFLNVSVAETHGVLTFYHELRTAPPADVVVSLCSAEACQASGSRALRDEVASAIAPVGGRSADGGVDVVEVFCLGNCAFGPAALVNERLVGRVDLDRLHGAVASAREEARA
ncbi:MAG TPA: NAD(P)H-dependent oxidoreductase subunit E [Candidatus Nanopelagicales bacterium]|nr:NAD(P)H-dependent oxidoreductase subunit E [Candidatus Nanopelagicales bacterium]